MRFPRLSPHKAAAGGVWSELKQAFLRADERGYDSLLDRPLPDLDRELFAASGSPKVTQHGLIGLRESLNAAMYGVAGFPNGNSNHIVQEVDRALCKALATHGLPTGEMLRADTWCWICIHLMPHYVYWRWWENGAITEERVMGGVVRNGLGRLWLRATVLDLGAAHSDRWRLLDRMPEDACTALLERTTISSNHRLSRALIDAWLTAKEGHSSPDKLLRTAMVRARVQTSVIETAVLNDADLMQVALDNFR